MKVNLAVDLDIHKFSGSGITEYESGLRNCTIHMESGKPKITQRASIDLTEDASEIGGLLNRGRGIYYWEQNAELYIVNDDSIYETTQDSVAVGTISSGTQRLTILETLGGSPYLVFLDAENNEGWYMATSTTVTQIASNFPSTICHGGAILDTYTFVMDEDGLIYNSDANDPTTWNATSFLTTERENDKGVYLGKHHDHIVAFGTRTIEFFYDARNTSGTVLNRRQDVSYNIGCASGTAVWENGDTIYFIGSNRPGQLQIYKLENFQIIPISKDTLNSYITQGLTQEGLDIVFEGLSSLGNDTLLMTVYALTGASPGEILPKITLSYDSFTQLWGFWCTQIDGLSCFPLMSFTKRTGGQNATVSARTGEGIMYNGDIININDNLVPVDTVAGSDGVYVAGVYEVDVYVSSTASTGTNIQVIIRTGMQDFGTRQYKFQNSETIIAEETESAQTLTIKHADEKNSNFDSGETIDLTDERKELHQGGRFTKRNYELEYSGNEQIYIDEFDVDVQAGF